jgi:hypothetical protein
VYRADDVPIVVERGYGLDSTFILHSRAGQPDGERNPRS